MAGARPPKAKIWTRTDPWLTQRLDSTATVRRGDVAITNAVMNAMSLWLHAVTRAIYGHTTPDVLRADAGDSTTPPPDSSGLLPDLNLWPAASAWQSMIDDVVIPEVSKLFGKAFSKATRDADISPADYRQAYMSLVSDRLSRNLWPNDVFDAVRDVIADGIKNGDSIDKITADLRPVMETQHYQWQARRIARTETMGAVNGGSWSGATAYADVTGTEMFKQWFATRDSRTREDHRNAHRQVVPLTADFNVGGWALSYPGDPDGPADEVINCRCTFLTLSASEAAHYTDPDAWDDNPDQITTSVQEDPAVTSTLTAAAPAAPTAPDDADQLPDDDATDPGAPTAEAWSGLLVPFDTPSGDGRMVAAPAAGGMRVRPLPLPLLYQDALDSAHKGAVRVGLITSVEQRPEGVYATGTFNLNDPRAAAIAEQLAAGQLGWVSVDLDDTTSEFVQSSPDSEDGVEVCSDWRLMGATLVPYQAFPDAKITSGAAAAAFGVTETGSGVTSGGAAATAAAFGVLAANTGLPVADAGTAWDGSAAAQRVAQWATKSNGDLDPSKYERAFLYRDGDAGNVTSYKLGYGDIIGGDLKIVPKGVYAIAGALSGARSPLKVPDADMAGLKAAAGRLYGKISSALKDPSIKAPWASSAEDAFTAAAAATAVFSPPSAWFDTPALDGPTPITLTEDGRIFGHLAPWNVCHIGIPDACRTAPRSACGYAYFHLGSVRTAEGTELAVGTITLGTDHAGGRASLSEAQRHYADTGMAAAVVRAGEDEFGIWVAGAVLPGADIATLRRAPLSGDWRRIGGSMELVGALAVNTPGFPIPRMRWHSVNPGELFSLTAAGALQPAAGGAPVGQAEEITVESFAREVAASLDRFAAERADRERRFTAARRAARTVRADRALSRLHTLMDNRKGS